MRHKIRHAVRYRPAQPSKRPAPTWTAADAAEAFKSDPGEAWNMMRHIASSYHDDGCCSTTFQIGNSTWVMDRDGVREVTP